MEYKIETILDPKMVNDSLTRISQSVLNDSDIYKARENESQLTGLLKQQDYQPLMRVIKRVAGTFKVTDEFPVDKPLDPFTNVEAAMADESMDVKAHANQENILDCLGKLTRRALFVSFEYRVAREFLKEVKSNPKDMIGQLGFDHIDYSGLDGKFKIFVNAMGFYADKAKILMENCDDENYFMNMEPHLALSLSTNLLNTIIGGITSVERDEMGNVLFDKGIGFYYICSTSYLYNKFPDEIPKLIDSKKSFKAFGSKIKECLKEARPTLLDKARAIDEEYAVMISNGLESVLKEPAEQKGVQHHPEFA